MIKFKRFAELPEHIRSSSLDVVNEYARGLDLKDAVASSRQGSSKKIPPTPVRCKRLGKIKS
jgi:hypothetical protein